MITVEPGSITQTPFSQISFAGGQNSGNRGFGGDIVGGKIEFSQNKPINF